MAHCLEALNQACKDKRPLRLTGGASKLGAHVGNDDYSQLSLAEFSGVINYEPSELFITAMAGTSLREITDLLAEQGQRPACDAPILPGATLGGTLATNAAGSAAHSRGRVRDAVLGLEMVNGLGRPLRFGGELMKNVAGFDIARLNCGAYGRLGPIVAATLRVQSLPGESVALMGPECNATEALGWILANSHCNGVAAASWYNTRLLTMLEGTSTQLDALYKKFSNWEETDPNQGPWQVLAHQNIDKLVDNHDLVVRMSCLPHTPIDCLPDNLPVGIDQGGALRWYRLNTSPYLKLQLRGVFRDLASQGIHLARHTHPHMPLSNLVAVDKPLADLQRRVLAAFDPHGLCNPDLNWYGL